MMTQLRRRMSYLRQMPVFPDRYISRLIRLIMTNLTLLTQHAVLTHVSRAVHKATARLSEVDLSATS